MKIFLKVTLALVGALLGILGTLAVAYLALQNEKLRAYNFIIVILSLIMSPITIVLISSYLASLIKIDD